MAAARFHTLVHHNSVQIQVHQLYPYLPWRVLKVPTYVLDTLPVVHCNAFYMGIYMELQPIQNADIWTTVGMSLSWSCIDFIGNEIEAMVILYKALHGIGSSYLVPVLCGSAKLAFSSSID